MKKLIFNLLFLMVTFFSSGQVNQIEELKRLIGQNQCEKGLEIISDLIAKKKATNLVYFYKASCEQEKKLFESSIVSATSGLEITNKSDSLYPSLLLLRFLSYANAGKLDLGIVDNETLVKAFPKEIGYLLNLSFLYGENNQFSDCLRILQKALTIDSLNVSIINNLAY